MLHADAILAFYQSLVPPKKLPKSVVTLNPYQSPEGWKTTETFYKKYYADQKDRHILFGINPGRFGCGVTGIPFTDPGLLESDCEIPNDLPKRAELSSGFIYDVIRAYGGPDAFFSQFFITGVSPLGFMTDSKNLNYYDIKNWKEIFKKDVVKWIRAQLEFGIKTDKAYSIGKGDNLKFLNLLNKEYQFFDEIIPLPHPRWVMQYRTKRKLEFVDEYVEKLSKS